MSTNDKVEMTPSDFYKTRFETPIKWHSLPNFILKVIETLSSLHEIKMRTDEPAIAETSQKLINLLILKYPNLVPQIDNSFSKNSNR
ncbi:MAG: hypothetical protein PHI97_28395 [Desulfobulbus sp.]|nr:hypothetical protein [Desulfobulbus sp.]